MPHQRVALITGSSRGIGAGVASYLLAKNYFVHMTYLKDKRLAEKNFKRVAHTMLYHLDVGDEKNVKKVVKSI